jgi:hypothetical protein
MNRLGDQNKIKSPSTPKLSTIQIKSLKNINNNNNKTPILQPPSINPLRLLIEKLVFLDINTSYKHSSKLKECLTTIGVVSFNFS